MGATSIGFTLELKASEKEVKDAFSKQQEEDRARHGHCEGYSGDFQTVDTVQCHFNTVMDSLAEAESYCLDNAKKWSFVVAVHFKSNTPEEKNKIHTLIAGWGAQ